MFTVSKVITLQDKNTGIPVGNAVVSFETRDDMETALKYPEHKVDGKVVSWILFSHSHEGNLSGKVFAHTLNIRILSLQFFAERTSGRNHSQDFLDT